MQLLAKFKKILYMEFRATLNFRKFNSSLELDIVFRRSYFFIIIDKTDQLKSKIGN